MFFIKEERLEYNKNGVPRVKRYVDEMDGIPITDLWTDIRQIQGNEKLDYATQKPIKLLERIINASSDEGDLVLAAEKQRRPYNVIFIMGDDYSTNQIGCYGSTECRTPNIDRLAAEGDSLAEHGPRDSALVAI